MSDTKQQESRTGHNNKASSRQQTGNRQITSVWEKITASIGLLLVLSSVGFILFQGIWGNETPPDVQISIESIQPVSTGYLVKFTSKNEGGSSLAGVVVQAQLTKGEDKIETSQTTIEFLPANSLRKGGFFFRNNPKMFRLEARTLGYQEP